MGSLRERLRFWEVTLRSVGDDTGLRVLVATRDVRTGDLTIAGHSVHSGGGESEWWWLVRRADIPALLRALDAEPGTRILRELRTRWAGQATRELEHRLKELEGRGLAQLSVWRNE